MEGERDGGEGTEEGNSLDVKERKVMRFLAEASLVCLGFFFVVVLVWAALHGLEGFSSLTRDQPAPPSSRSSES